MKLPPLPFVVLDTETTGFLPRVHRIIEFASVCIRPFDSAQGKLGKIADTCEQLFSIPGGVPPQVEVLTRIKSSALEGKPAFESMRGDIERHLPADCILVGQNLGFDLSMLKGEGIDLTDRPWIDTSLLASLVFPELRSYSLGYMSTALRLNHEPAHRAMGDVRATLELLGKIWERLTELPPEAAATAKDVMQRSTPGYRMLFEMLEGEGKKRPEWFRQQRVTLSLSKGDTRAMVRQAHHDTLASPPLGTVALREESLHPDSLQALLDAADRDPAVHWIAVKNLESAVRKVCTPTGAQVLYPPSLLLDPEAAEALRGQTSFTADEATLMLKIAWWEPRIRSDIAVHGGERDVWNGKLACTETSRAYIDQFAAKASSFVVDHRQLLAFVADPQHAAHGTLTTDSHVIIDDASMLEDTATKAYGHFCALDDVRAAAQGNDLLTKLADLASLWAEKTRGAEDAHFLTAADLARPETKAMLLQIDGFLGDGGLPDRTRQLLAELRALLRSEHFDRDIRWIETRPNQSIHLHSAPERVDALLKTTLYDRFPTTLVVPEGSNGVLPEVLPPRFPTIQQEPLGLPACTVTVTFREDQKLADVLQSPPAGRTIVLASSKRLIEQLFVQFTEILEKKGITMICQGLSGGQGRMEADFLAAATPVLWLLTPWMYEGVELLDGGADHLVLETVPFDHPGQPVFARRKTHYRNAFEEYCLPRVEHRLFRLLRTFCRHRTEGGDVTILDGRLRERGYGPRVRSFIETISGASAKLVEATPEKKEKPKKEPGQQALF